MILLIVIYFAFISLGLPDSLIGAIWPVMHTDLNTKLEYAGFISAFVSVGTVISSFMLGKLASRFKSSTITIGSIILTAIGLLIYSQANSLLAIFLGAIPLGLGGGAIDSTLNAYVAEHYKAKHMSFLHGCWGIGTLIGPILFGFLLGQGNSWRLGYQILAIVQLSIMLSVFFSRPLWTDAKRDMSIKVEKPGYKEVLKQPGAINAILGFFLYVGFETSMIMWSGSYFVYTKGLSPDIASFITSLFFIGITSSRIITGFLSTKFSDKTLIISGLTLAFISAILMLFAPGRTGAIFLFLAGFGCGPIYPLMMHESSFCFKKQYIPSIIGMQAGFAYFGIISIPAIFGYISKFTGQGFLPLYFIIFVVFAFINYLAKRKQCQKTINSLA